MLEADFFKQLLVRAERGDFRGAMEELAWAIQVDPTDAKAYYCRGMLHCKQQHYRQAIADFNQALHCISPGESSPDVGSIFRNRGKARIQLGDYLGAITDFEQALKQDPQDAAVYVARGNAYRLSGKYVEAIQDYSQALKINPKDALAYYNRAIAQVCIEETQQASEDYQRAASQFCEQEDWENYQKALDSLKKLQKAMPRARPEDLTALLRQRLLRLVGGHWEIAERLIQQLKQKRPGMAEEWYLDRVIQQIQRDGR
ncbi:MAG: tetratricopeptide repeat protein [Oscillatoriales cyanobacterium RM1_1_9]|nr:tetratricopeptide repeat protein [Oscillatoriales cyanobacterium RM1_1_9]